MIFSNEQIVGKVLAEKIEDWIHLLGQKVRDLRSSILAPWRFLKNVWSFRKELWRFRTWDYKFNVDLFRRSFELTAAAMESEDAVSANALEDAKEMRKFIRYLEIYSDPYTEAEKILGVKYMELHDKAMGKEPCSWNYLWMNKPKEEWTPEQLKLIELQELIHTLEERSWKNAWKLIGRRGRGWWD
jgi:hypothetical protein